MMEWSITHDIDRRQREDTSVIEGATAGAKGRDDVGCCEDVGVADAIVSLNGKDSHDCATREALM